MSSSVAVVAVSLFASAIFIYLLTELILSSPSEKRYDEEKIRFRLEDPYIRRRIIRLEVGGIVAGVFALIFAVAGLQEANNQSAIAHEALLDQRTTSAWQLLSQAQPGSGGKAYALASLINESDLTLSGLDLSCGVDPEPLLDDIYRRCRKPNIIENLQIGNASGKPSEISQSDFSYIRIRETKFENLYLTDVNFRHTNLFNVEIQNSVLEGLDFSNSQFSNLIIQKSGLSHVNLRSALFGLEINESTLNNVRIPIDGITITDSFLYVVDFSNIELFRNSIKLVNLRNFESRRDEGLISVDGSPPPGEFFNISGSVFCENYDEMICWEGATQEFLNHAWFEKSNPPKGLHLLPYEARIRIGCDSPIENFYEDGGIWSRDYGAEYGLPAKECLAGELKPIGELFK